MFPLKEGSKYLVSPVPTTKRCSDAKKKKKPAPVEPPAFILTFYSKRDN